MMSRRHQRQALVLLVYLSVTLVIIYTLYNDWYLKYRTPNYAQNRTVNSFLSASTIQEWKKTRINSSVSTILLWTPFFGHYELWYFGIRGNTLSNCRIKCEFTTDKTSLMTSEAVVFHARDITSVRVPLIRHPDQVWVFLNRESPLNTFVDLTPYVNIFNWTMTYRLDSDVYFPYGVTFQKGETSFSSSSFSPSQLHKAEPDDGLKSGSYLTQAKIQSLISKPKLVAWIVSNCVTHSNRESFVKELREHIEVDIYGKCGTLSCPSDDSHQCYEHISSKYKFYLSFENSLCTDYVTEKYFDALKFDMVPVVYGRVNYSRISPPYSFIDATNFNSSNDLANYLLYLTRHDEEYLNYFKWKEKFTISRSAASGWCALCEKLTAHAISGRKSRKVYQNIGRWWNTQPQPPPPFSLAPYPRRNPHVMPMPNPNQAHKPVCLDIPVFKSESFYNRFLKIFL